MSWCQEIIDEIPGADLRVIPDHGHGTLITDSEPAAELIQRFADDSDSAATCEVRLSIAFVSAGSAAKPSGSGFRAGRGRHISTPNHTTMTAP